MASTRWLAIPILVTLSAALFAACSSTVSPEVAASSSSSGAGGLGGAGGAQTAASVTTGVGGTSPEAGPLTCPTHSYSTIKTGPCDLLAQDCPAGSTCKETLLSAGWSTHCVLSNGLKGEGEKCLNDDECAEKLTCSAGRCAPVCCKATNAPCLGGICNLFIRLDETGKVTKQVCHYAKACTLLVADACEKGYDCHIEDGVQGLATCVQPNVIMPDLGYCQNINDCSNMEDCFQGKSKKQCHYYCKLQPDAGALPVGLGGCPMGQACVNKVDGVDVDFNLPDIGLCALLGG